MPHAQERLGDDVQMVVAHVSQANILTTAHAEETVAELGGVEECLERQTSEHLGYRSG